MKGDEGVLSKDSLRREVNTCYSDKVEQFY